MHLKRNKAGKFWTTSRKATKYVAVATHNKKNSIPLVVVMRDILKLTDTKKELKKNLNEKKILINHKEIKESNYPVCLFDIITIKDMGKNLRANFSDNKKMIFEEIPDEKANTKIYKIIDKKKIDKNKIQLNLMQGKNILSNEKARVGDSVLLNLKNNKIEKIMPLEKGRIAFAIKGKHTGISGKITEIVERGGKKLAKIEVSNEKINVWTKNIIIIG